MSTFQSFGGEKTRVPSLVRRCTASGLWARLQKGDAHESCRPGRQLLDRLQTPKCRCSLKSFICSRGPRLLLEAGVQEGFPFGNSESFHPPVSSLLPSLCFPECHRSCSIPRFLTIFQLFSLPPLLQLTLLGL